MRKSTLVTILGLLGLLAISAGAQLSGPTLTKDKAKDIIEATDNYKPRKWAIPLAKTDADSCVARGYLQWATIGPAGKASTVLSVTDKGKQLFDSASGGQVFGSPQPDPLFAVVAAPIRPHVVEVTDIADGANGVKIVEYQWNWDGKSQPQEVQDLILKNQPTGHAKVTLKMSDDGWHVIKFE